MHLKNGGDRYERITKLSSSPHLRGEKQDVGPVVEAAQRKKLKVEPTKIGKRCVKEPGPSNGRKDNAYGGDLGKVQQKALGDRRKEGLTRGTSAVQGTSSRRSVGKKGGHGNRLAVSWSII